MITVPEIERYFDEKIRVDLVKGEVLLIINCWYIYIID